MDRESNQKGKGGSKKAAAARKVVTALTEIIDLQKQIEELEALSGPLQAQLDGFKSRVLRVNAQRTQPRACIGGLQT